jgi:hypothetical protein
MDLEWGHLVQTLGAASLAVGFRSCEKCVGVLLSPGGRSRAFATSPYTRVGD